MNIDIIDIGIGNVISIDNLCRILNLEINIVTEVSDLKSDIIILPGVGSVKKYMEILKEKGFDIALKKHINSNKKLIGICLGFQVLGKSSEEDGGVECLGFINGHVSRINKNTNNGWQNFELSKDKLTKYGYSSHLCLTKKRTVKGRVFYNHEYGFVNFDDRAYTKHISDDLLDYSAIYVKDNIMGIQFHPEKSQSMGIDIFSIIL